MHPAIRVRCVVRHHMPVAAVVLMLLRRIFPLRGFVMVAVTFMRLRCAFLFCFHHAVVIMGVIAVTLFAVGVFKLLKNVLRVSATGNEKVKRNSSKEAAQIAMRTHRGSLSPKRTWPLKAAMQSSES